MTGATPNPPGISSGLQREAPPRMSRRGYRTMFRSESFPSHQGIFVDNIEDQALVKPLLIVLGVMLWQELILMVI